MKNIVNIDLNNNSCWGTTNTAENINKIDLYIKLPGDIDKSNVKLEFTKVDVSIITTGALTVNDNLVNYEMPFSMYETKGTIKLRVVANDYSSDYIIFNISEDLTEIDDICALYNFEANCFSINKCYHQEAGEVTVSVGTVTTGDPGTDAKVINSGTATDVILDFTIPRGDIGDTGKAATVSVGTVTTGDPGTEAEVVNSGTDTNAILNFVIPKGEHGSTPANCEYTTNKVTTINSSSTDNQYPSAKCVYNMIGLVEKVLAALNEGAGV